MLIELLAKKRLFLRDATSIDLEKIEISSHESLELRAYSIRRAVAEDINSLLAIELSCWPDEMQLPAESLLQRLEDFPDGQWVAIVDNEVIGVIYTLRISYSENSMLYGGSTFENQRSFRAVEGDTLQLLGVAVLHSFGHLLIGQALRDFALMYAKLTPGIDQVVAMTRCSAYDRSINYGDYVYSICDPTIRFHVDSGATIIGIVSGYRISDVQNAGNGVLIKYNIKDARMSRNLSEENKHDLIHIEDLYEYCSHIMGIDLSRLMDLNEFFDKPFMNIGMDSLQLMELSSRIKKNFPHLFMSPTMLFDFPSPGKLIMHMHSKDGYTVNSEKKNINVGAKKKYFAVTGISCRFPGMSGTTPEEFYASLCSGDNLVSDLPKEWKTDTAHNNPLYPKGAVFLQESLAQSFDPLFFGMGDAEAQLIDPHQRFVFLNLYIYIYNIT